MIIGSGQLAKQFMQYKGDELVVFASGVSNSSTKEESEFLREEKLLTSVLQANQEKKIIYFSSCALSSKQYPRNPYYEHKILMEELIKRRSDNYYIFRLPQLFGDLKKHHTLINFIYYKILNDEPFDVFDQGYRYVIEINDVELLVRKFLEYKKPALVADLSNTYRYSAIEIVKVFEKLLNKKARVGLIQKDDGYVLDLADLENFINNYGVGVDFGESYLESKLRTKIMAKKRSD